jgi:hypothetical protein
MGYYKKGAQPEGLMSPISFGINSSRATGLVNSNSVNKSGTDGVLFFGGAFVSVPLYWPPVEMENLVGHMSR